MRKLALLFLLLPFVSLTYACDARWPAEPEAAAQTDHPTFASRPNWQSFDVDSAGLQSHGSVGSSVGQ